MGELGIKPVLLWSDALIFMLVIVLSTFFYRLRNDPQTRERWSQVFSQRLGMVTCTVIMVYVGIALLDSLHFRRALANPEGADTMEVFYDNKVISVLDVTADERDGQLVFAVALDRPASGPVSDQAAADRGPVSTRLMLRQVHATSLRWFNSV